MWSDDKCCIKTSTGIVCDLCDTSPVLPRIRPSPPRHGSASASTREALSTPVSLSPESEDGLCWWLLWAQDVLMGRECSLPHVRAPCCRGASQLNTEDGNLLLFHLLRSASWFSYSSQIRPQSIYSSIHLSINKINKQPIDLKKFVSFSDPRSV